MDFYSEEDFNGKTGQPGQVQSYDCGYITQENAEIDAKEMGYSLEEYLKTWWDEVSTELPWTWETLGGGYGHHGTDIFTQVEPNGGILHCKEIFGQIMFDVYPPLTNNESKTNNNMKKNTVKLNEAQLKKIVAESVRRVMREERDWNHYNDGPSQEEETFQDELYSVIEGYGLNIARFYGNEEFIKWCVEIINNALNANKK